LLGMLAAHKALLVADVQQRATMLRRLELDVVIRRFTSLIAVVSISAGFAFDSLSVIYVPDDFLSCFVANEPSPPPAPMLPSNMMTPPSPPPRQEYCDDSQYESRIRSYYSLYFVCAAIALASGIFVITTSTFIVNWAQRLAVAGEKSGRSLEVAVTELFGFFPVALAAAGVSVLSILLAGFAIIWVKDNIMSETHVWIATGFVFGIGIGATAIHSAYLIYSLRFSGFVHGDVQLEQPAEASTPTHHGHGMELLNPVDGVMLQNRASSEDRNITI